MNITESDFQRLQSFLKGYSGISLSVSKKYLVSNRLTSLVVSNNFTDLTELIDKIESYPSGVLAKDVIDEMTTNETFWFRDEKQFRLLEKKLLPDLAASNRQIKVWSAACSSGQEAYTVSVYVQNHF